MSFRHILFPVDFSALSRDAAPFVRALAVRYSASVTLLHITESQDQREEAARQLATFASTEFPGMSVTQMADEGDAGSRIAQLAGTLDADLVMMATHGRGGLGRALLGSVTARALHASKCPVWTNAHPEAGHTDPKTILCAIELEPESVALLRYAKALAIEFGAALHIVHAVPAKENRPEADVEQPLEVFLHDFARQEIAKLQAEAGTNLDSFVELGNVSQVVCAAAKKFNADLVIIGRGVLNRFAGDLRTEAYAIIRESPCPVLTV